MTDPNRTAKLESDLSHVAKSLDDFIQDSVAHRESQREDIKALWTAHKDLGERMTAAVTAISEKGRITWPMIVTTGGFVLSLIVAAASIIDRFAEERAKRLEAVQDYQRRDLDRHERLLESCRAEK